MAQPRFCSAVVHGGVGSSAGPWPRRAWYLASLAERSLPCHTPHNLSFKCTQPVAFALSGKQVISSRSTVVIRDKHPKLQLTHPSVMDCAAYLAIIFYHVVIFCAVLCMLGSVYSSRMPVFQGRLTPEWWKWERQVIHFSKLAVPPHFRHLGTIMSCIAPQPCFNRVIWKTDWKLEMSLEENDIELFTHIQQRPAGLHADVLSTYFLSLMFNSAQSL